MAQLIASGHVDLTVVASSRHYTYILNISSDLFISIGISLSFTVTVLQIVGNETK